MSAEPETGLRAVAARLREERGVALTEFALVLPVLMLIFLGMLDFGKAFNYWIDQTHLANMGARWAVVNKNPGAPAQTFQQYITSLTNTSEQRTGGTTSFPTAADAAKACVSFPGKTQATAAVGDPVEVKVRANYHFLGFVGLKIGFLSVPIEGKATMRLEQRPTNYFESAC
jgi:Flp pilus assembly protein TadG